MVQQISKFTFLYYFIYLMPFVIIYFFHLLQTNLKCRHPSTKLGLCCGLMTRDKTFRPISREKNRKTPGRRSMHEWHINCKQNGTILSETESRRAITRWGFPEPHILTLWWLAVFDVNCSLTKIYDVFKKFTVFMQSFKNACGECIT